jgi:hypothetical protein
MCATASLVTVEGLCGQVAHAAAQDATPAPAGGWLRRDQFEACRGQAVIVRTSSRSMTLWLMAVDDVPSAHHTGAVGDRNSFIVVFQGPRSPKLAQGTYQVESRTLGTFPLFLVPESTYPSVRTYVATFNRVAPSVVRLAPRSSTVREKSTTKKGAPRQGM